LRYFGHQMKWYWSLWMLVRSLSNPRGIVSM
jgi:hypothetical protein